MANKERSPLGEAILDVCRERNVSQKQMADDIGVKKEYLNNVINGYAQPSLDMLIKIATIYDKALIIEFAEKGDGVPNYQGIAHPKKRKKKPFDGTF